MIVALVYATNECYTNVVEIDPLDPKTWPKGLQGLSTNGGSSKTWTWKFDNRERPFANMRHCQHGCRYGVIGVYDTDDIEQLNSMVFHSKEATSDPNYGDD